MSDERLTIGMLARSTGVATSALRYWEQLGLLTAPVRESGQRRYASSAVRLVGLILLLREVGFTLREIRTLVADRAEDPVAWQELYQRKLVELDEQISRAQVARTALAHGLACPHDGGVFDCPNFTAAVSARLDGRPLREAHAQVH
jgi:MerR family redox-sensitive transcriptional activator SoxR